MHWLACLWLLLCATVVPAQEAAREEWLPGRAAPAAAADAGWLRFAWDEYETLIVVGDGAGVIRPAWVVTWQGGQWQVAYRATAFRDAAGHLHIDARQARCLGPLADRWSPDSFALIDDHVQTLDDIGNAHRAPAPLWQPAANDPVRWRDLLRLARSLAEGGS